MNLDFQQTLKRPGWLKCEMPLIISWMPAVSAANPAANSLAGRNFDVTICERKPFINFGGRAIKNPVKPSQTQSNPVKPNSPPKKAWIFSARFKTGMEARNP
jgi:hypothetical protein